MVWLAVCRHSSHHRFRIAVVMVLLCAVFSGAVGVPTFPFVLKNKAVPFPCQDRPCGCKDAQSCWRKCCCHTNSEKVAWAKRNGVSPPEFVLIAAKNERQSRTSCCSSRTAKTDTSCCDSKAPPRKSCCSKTTQTPQADKASSLVLVCAVVQIDSYRKCQGLGLLWQVLSAALECHLENPIQRSTEITGRLTILSDVFSSHAREPELPPPQDLCGS